MNAAVSTPEVPEIPRGTRWALIGVLALALVLRLLEARGLRLEFDEIYIVMVARMSPPDVVRTAAADIHPPLHFLVRHLWQALGGEGDRWLKLLSMVFSLVTVGFTEALGRRMVSPRAGLLAALFTALCPRLIVQGQMVDVYPMIQMLLVFMVWASWRAVTERRVRHHVMLAIGTVLALYTGYLAIPVSAALLLWGAWALRRERGALAAWLGTWAVAILVFVPWMPTLVAQFHREGSASFFRFPTPGGLLVLAREIAFGSYLAPALFAVVLMAALLDTRRRSAVALVVAVLVCTVPATRLWAFVLTRDMLALAPLVYVLVVAGIGRLPGRLTPVIAAVLMIAIAAREVGQHQRFREPLQLTLVEGLVRHGARPEELVLHAETHSLLFFRHYQPDRRNLLLVDPGYHVPFFDGGLVVPDAWLITPAEWAAARDSGADWWGVRVDRAFTTHGRSTRAGARDAAEFDSLSHERTWTFAPVQLWHGGAARH